MNAHEALPLGCSNVCDTTQTADELNRQCFCLGVDRTALRAGLESILAEHGVPAELALSHPNLFSSLPVFVAPTHIEAVGRVVAAVEEVASLPAWAESVLAWAPAIAQYDPGSPGGLLGLDFHLSPSGPRLIEINTNPGGVLLNAVLAQAQQSCLAELVVPAMAPDRIEQAVLAALLSEWRLQRGDAPLATVAIVDEDPERQFLFPEFVLFRQLLRNAGLRAEICSSQRLQAGRGRLLLDGVPVDYVYNRLTDFSLALPAHRELREAYLSGEVVLSPHPRAHALLADKRNLALLGNEAFLRAAGASAAASAALLDAVPATRVLTAENRDQMWMDRRGLFFKPATGFGSKASYRGDKLTRRVWDEMAGAAYVAQDIVAPSERHLALHAPPLKVDVRCYASAGTPLLFAARMYQGQTTNFRTPGGGFAPVLTCVTQTAAPSPVAQVTIQAPLVTG